MTGTVAVIDYGMGNLHSVASALEHVGADRVPYISLEGNVNMAGGQPFSMANLRELHDYCREHDIQIMLDISMGEDGDAASASRQEVYSTRPWSCSQACSGPIEA